MRALLRTGLDFIAGEIWRIARKSCRHMGLRQWEPAAKRAALFPGQIMLTIVVIEQDIAMRTLFCEWLEAEGYGVRGRSDRPMAIESDIDLVIVDLLNLPTQGTEAVKQVRNSFPGATLIGISTQLSRTLTADSPQARSLGVRGLVAKPCTRSELVSAVVDAIGVAN